RLEKIGFEENGGEWEEHVMLRAVVGRIKLGYNTTRKRSTPDEVPYSSKKQKPTPVTLSSTPNEDTTNLPTINEQPTAATMQDPLPSDQPSKDKKKKKKKKDKKASHLASHEDQPNEPEAKEEASRPSEDPPQDQSEKKKKHKKPSSSTIPAETHIVEAEMPKVSEVDLDRHVQPQNSPQPVLQEDPSPTKVVKDVVEELNAAQQDTLLERTPSPQLVETLIPSNPPSPKPTGALHLGAEDAMLEPNNEDAILNQGPPHESPILVQTQMPNPSGPVLDAANAEANQNVGVANEQDQPLECEHSITNQPQPSGLSHGSGSINTNSFDSDDDDAQTGDSYDEKGTSVSKPPPSIILPAKLAKELKDLTPTDALSKLLLNHGTSNPNAEDKESLLEQEQFDHELRFKREIIDGDMLGLLERDSSIYFNIKAFTISTKQPIAMQKSQGSKLLLLRLLTKLWFVRTTSTNGSLRSRSWKRIFDKIDELAHEGLQHYSDGLAVQRQVERLSNDKEVLQRKDKDQSLTTKDSKVQRPLGRGRIKKPAFKPARTRILRPRRAKDKEVETIILSSDSSGSDDTDSDYAEFLSTWEPDEHYPRSLSSEKEESQASEHSNSDSKEEEAEDQDKP
ncbi:hypothetical protein L195_g019750, partial [Trifolium pratense]